MNRIEYECMEKIYRFRRAGALLNDFRELENQTIYFASPEELNDPLEGYRDIVWKGDRIVWTNLFRNYILTLLDAVMYYKIIGNEHELNKDHINVFLNPERLETEKYVQLYERIVTESFENELIKKTIEVILTRRGLIRKSELTYYLNSIHLTIMSVIMSNFKKDGLDVKEDNFPVQNSKSIIEIYEKIISAPKQSKLSEQEEDLVIELSTQILEREMLMLQFSRSRTKEYNPNSDLILSSFSRIYVENLTKLAFPKWYTSCFMSECTNSSVWGHYAENHTGMCLIFNVERNGLQLTNVPGCSPKGRNFEFHKISYEKDEGTIDFFNSLGRLSMGELKKHWLTDSEGTKSESLKIFDDEELFRKNYWAQFYRDITRKTKDWEYENEFRLIQDDTFHDLTDSSTRVYQYEFSSLNGIIFGINTSSKDKIKAIEILEEKCFQHNILDFKFYQAYYNSVKGRIDHYELRSYVRS